MRSGMYLRCTALKGCLSTLGKTFSVDRDQTYIPPGKVYVSPLEVGLMLGMRR